MSARKQRRFLPEMLERRTLLSATPQGPEFKVNTWTTSNQINSSLSMDGQGNFVVVWQSAGQDTGTEGIYAQRFSSGGTLLDAEFRVNQFTTGNQTLPVVAMDLDGDFVVAWQSPAQEGILGEIWARRFTSAGTPAGDEFHVNETTTNNQFAPAVATDDAGNFVMAWHSQSGNADVSYDVYARRYNAAGTALSSEFQVNTYTTSSQNSASVAMDTDGDFVIVWRSYGQDGAGNGIVARRFDQAGMAVGVEFLVNQFTPGQQNAPSVSMDGNGAFVVAWESGAQEGATFGYGVYARRYDSAGMALGDEFHVNTYTTDAQRVPAVAVDMDGDFVITWASRLQDGSLYGIYAQAYSSGGTAEGNEFKVNTTTTASQFNPAVAIDSDGDFVVTWQSDQQDLGGFGIYAQRFGQSVVDPPHVISSIFVWENAPQRLEYQFSADVSASLSNADILLENLTTLMTIPMSAISVAYAVATNTATFTFSFPATWLPDGRYKATLLAAGITDPGGAPLPSDHVSNFYFLQGDANHDAIVNLSDFNRLATNFGLSPRDFTEGDFNYDGTVNLADFNLLAGRFGMSVAPAISQRAGTFGGTRIGKAAGKRAGVASKLTELA